MTMPETVFDKLEFMKVVFDAIPSPMFLVDSDVRIQHLNATASSTLGINLAKGYLQRGGEALHCIHSLEVPEGCGFSSYCSTCIIRNAVSTAFREEKVYRKKHLAQLVDGDSVRDVTLLVTTVKITFDDKSYVLLILEDITEISQLRNLLPICANCKKIRNDEQYWETVEGYFYSHHDLHFTHGMCPDCAKKLYPEIKF
jgi:PAS domain-containing protein